MAIVYNDLGIRLKGRMGDYIFCTRNGTTYIRKAVKNPDPTLNERLKTAQSRLRWTRNLYTCIIKNTTLVDSWKIAGKVVSKNCYNYFVSENYNIFNNKATISDYSLLKISKGSLKLPPYMECEVISEDSIQIKWLYDDLNQMGKKNDKLYVYMMYDDNTFKFIYLDNLKSKRKDGVAIIQLPDEEYHPVHIYCFFGSKEKDKFTDSKYLNIKWK